MLEKILQFSKDFDMFSGYSEVICGLSGGADSVCLMLALDELKNEFNVEVSALHVNHCLRGDESLRDENYCRELCERLGIPLKVVTVDVNAHSKKNKTSIEESARILRYEAFFENSKEKCIATAHNANDNIETILHNLIRGTALKGLCGIPATRDNIIRPLLCVSRDEIEEYLKKKNIVFVTDSTNLSDDYTRNNIRHNIIPKLKEINTSLIKTSINSINALRLENSFIEEQISLAIKNCRIENRFYNLKDYHKVIRQRCMINYLNEKNISYYSDRLELIDQKIVDGGKINLSNDIYFISNGEYCEIIEINDNKTQEIQVKFKIGNNSIFYGIILFAEILDVCEFEKNLNVYTMFTHYDLDYDKINTDVILRNRRSGDKIQLVGRNFKSSVKKLINAKIPLENRGELHFLQMGEDTILAENIGISDIVKVTSDTKRILRISIIKQ